jgi:hypothetical protein
LLVSFEFIVIAEREATHPVAATRMYERERESCVFWRLFSDTEQVKIKRKNVNCFQSKERRKKKNGKTTTL